MRTKTEAGRLLEAGVLEIHALRDGWELLLLSDGTKMPQPKHPARTLESIAKQVGVTLHTVQSICKGVTHPDLHPSNPLYWDLVRKAETS